MGVLKATIGGVDVTTYLKRLQSTPGGDGRVGTATLTLTKEAAGLDIRPMMVVQVWETFDGAGNGVANRGRFFGGLVRNRDTSNIGTTKTWQLSCDDFNLIGTRGLVRDMQAAKAVTLTAGTFAAQVTQLTQILQLNGAAAVNTEINTTDAVSAGGFPSMPAVTWEGGHTYFWYLGMLCAAAVTLTPALRPTFYLGTAITVGGSEDFGPPTLYLWDKASPPSAAFIFTDVQPTPVGEHPVYDRFERKSASNEIVQRQQLRTPTQVLTGENSAAATAYPNPYINHGIASNSGYWMDEPLQPGQVADNTAAQALIDRKVESAGYPRDSYTIITDQRLRNGEYIDLKWDLEGIPTGTLLQVVETQYDVLPTLEVEVVATLNARKLRLGQTAEDDVYAPPIEGDVVPPLPPLNVTLVSNVYNPGTGEADLTFSWDASPSPDTSHYLLVPEENSGYPTTRIDGPGAGEVTVGYPQGVAFEFVMKAVDTSNNIGEGAPDPPITGTGASPLYSELWNPSFEYLDRLDLTQAAGWTADELGTGSVTERVTTDQTHGRASLKMTVTGTTTEYAGARSDAFSVEGDKTYYWDFQARNTASSDNTLLSIKWFDAAGSEISDLWLISPTTVGTTWTRLEGATIAPTTAKSARLRIANESGSVATSLYVDNLHFAPQSPTREFEDDSVTPEKIEPGADGDVLTTAAGEVVWAPAGSAGATVMATLNYIIDGEGSVISTGAYPPIQFDFAGTIQSVTLLGDPVNVGSCVLDIWSDAYGNYPPTVADSITAAAKPTLSSATKYQDSTLTGWDTAIAAGDSWIINVDSASTLTYVVLSVKIQRASGGGTGAAALDDLTDVTITTPSTGEVLTYNGTQWVNDTAGAGSVALDDLTDVVITTPATGAVLKYNGTSWIDDAEAGIPATLVDAKGDIITATAADTPARLAVGTDGQFLKANSATATGLEWAAGGGGASALDDLTDVVITTPATNDVLLYDGTNWVNDTAPGGGGGAPTTAEYLTTASDGTLSAEVVIPGLAGSADRAGVAGGGTSEEFDTNTDPFTWSPSAPATHDSDTTIPSHLYIATTDTTERFGYKSWSPAGAFDARMKIGIGGLHTTSNILFGLLVADSGNTNRVLSSLVRANAPTSQALVRAHTYTGGAYTQRGSNVTWVMPWAYLRITRDGSNNVSFWFSMDGNLYQLLVTQAFTFTVANIGVWSQNGTASTTAIAAIDWLRTDV